MNTEVLLIIYLIINLLSFSIYGIDKLKAIRHKWRIPEKSLIFFAFLGPLGALLALLLFRHKIRNIKFTTLIPLFILIHIVILIKGDII